MPGTKGQDKNTPEPSDFEPRGNLPLAILLGSLVRGLFLKLCFLYDSCLYQTRPASAAIHLASENLISII